MKPSEVSSAHRRSVADAAANLFSSRSGLVVANRCAPDEIERGERAVDLRGDGPDGQPVLVLEHTSVDSFQDQRELSRWTIELLSPLELVLDGTLPGPGHYVLGVNPAESRGLRHSASRIRDTLTEWIREVAPKLALGGPVVAPRHCVDLDVLGLGLNVSLCRWPHWDRRFFMRFNVPQDFEQQRRARLVQALDAKCPKLTVAKSEARGASSVLVLETCDIALGNEFDIAAIVNEELRGRPDAPDVVYVIDTVRPGAEMREWSWLVAREGSSEFPGVGEPALGRFE